MGVPLEHFVARRLRLGDVERPALVATTAGPPVILLHEIYGMTRSVAAFGERIRAAGFRVWMPVLYGSAEPRAGAAAKALRMAQFACVARQFRIFSSAESGPWAERLRDLARQASAAANGGKVGVIGLCLTGNFALSMAAEPCVAAPVLGEPSLPVRQPKGLHVTDAELAAIKARPDVRIRAYRYATDRLCPAARFEALDEALPGRCETVCIETDAVLHSVFTEDLCDKSGAPRHDKVEEVIGFLRSRLP